MQGVAPTTRLGGSRGCTPAASEVLRADSAIAGCATPGTPDLRHLFSRQIPHIDEALLPQPPQVNGVLHALATADARFARGRNQPFALKRLDVRVDLPVVHADALCDVSRRVAARMPSQVPDDDCPQGIGIEHTQGLRGLLRLSGEWLVDAGHSSILTHRRSLKKYQHIFGDASITLKMMLLIAGDHQYSQEEELT